jgi:hypothetical protein
MDGRFNYVGWVGIVNGRAGETGFDKLVSQETGLEASTTLSNSIRLSVIAIPVFLLPAVTPTGYWEDSWAPKDAKLFVRKLRLLRAMPSYSHRALRQAI